MSHTQTDTAVILAAGWGSRMQGLAKETPVSKPLIALKGEAMLSRTIRTLGKAGIGRFVVVTGYLREEVEKATEYLASQTGYQIETVFNPKWDTLANGVSLLAAKDLIDGPFLLSMTDHAYDISIPEKLLAEGLGDFAVRLCIDRKIDTIFDIDDATKVETSDDTIQSIDKKLTEYNAIDIGVFYCTTEVFDALSVVYEENGDCSLSDGMRILGEKDKFGFMDIGDAYWQDADTPETLEYAEKLMNEGKIRFPE